MEFYWLLADINGGIDFAWELRNFGSSSNLGGIHNFYFVIVIQPSAFIAFRDFFDRNCEAKLFSFWQEANIFPSAGYFHLLRSCLKPQDLH